MVANDYWKTATGNALGIGDSYKSKIAAVEKV
jgi:hypothetical protein